MRAEFLAIVVALSGLAGASPAAAKPAARDPVLGAWAFETAPYKGGCKMRGEMSIRAGVAANRYLCSFVATETCPSFKVRADQSCTAVKDGAKLTVTAKIEKLSPADVPYAPDDWALTIVDSSRMIGELRSADIAPVTFYRGVGAIS